jgi:hypothetical protein
MITSAYQLGFFIFINMKGILAKKYDQWMVIYNEVNDDLYTVGLELPLHPEDTWIDTCDGNEGSEYDFDVVKYMKSDGSGKRWTELVAKLNYKITEDSNDLWINIYNDAIDQRIESLDEFVKWLKLNYCPPAKLKKVENDTKKNH